MTATKICSKCAQEKPIDEFSKNRSRHDGLAHYCKGCARNAFRKWKKNNPASYRASKRKVYWNDPEKSRATARLKREGTVESRRILSRSYRERDPRRMHAVNAVNRAVAAGKMPHIATLNCSQCGKKAQDYHHHSYEQEYWLDVIPLCSSCHRLVHTGTLQLEALR